MARLPLQARRDELLIRRVEAAGGMEIRRCRCRSHDNGVAGAVFSAAISICLAGCPANGTGMDVGSRRDLGADFGPAQMGCFESLLSVTCPGPTKPAIFCSKKRCVWVSNGKPAREFLSTVSSTCACQGTTCPNDRTVESFRYLWGAKPWTRERALQVQVRYDPNLSVTNPYLYCPDCPCDAVAAVFATSNRTFGLVRDMFDTLVLRTDLVQAGPNGSHNPATLTVEIDPLIVPPRARACLTYPSDIYFCAAYSADCAKSGVVTLSAKPDRTNASSLAATVDVQIGSRRIVLRVPPAGQGGDRNAACLGSDDGGPGDAVGESGVRPGDGRAQDI